MFGTRFVDVVEQMKIQIIKRHKDVNGEVINCLETWDINTNWNRFVYGYEP